MLDVIFGVYLLEESSRVEYIEISNVMELEAVKVLISSHHIGVDLVEAQVRVGCLMLKH